MKKVLITGAGGFVGKYIIEEFQEYQNPVKVTCHL